MTDKNQPYSTAAAWSTFWQGLIIFTAVLTCCISLLFGPSNCSIRKEIKIQSSEMQDEK